MAARIPILVFVCLVASVIADDVNQTDSVSAALSSFDPDRAVELGRPVVPKCCPVGTRLFPKNMCHPSPLEFVPIFTEVASVSSENFSDSQSGIATKSEELGKYYIIVGNPCKYGSYLLEPAERSYDEFYLYPNGSLYAPFLFGETPLPSSEFCMDIFTGTKTESYEVLPLICFQAEIEEENQEGSLQFILYPTGLILSLPFLLATLLAYAVTPALRDVHGKALICHVLCLVVAFLTLAIVQLSGSRMPDTLCITTAFIIQFSFIGCFMWMHVMCINTWWNIRSRWRRPRPLKRSRRRERRRFVLYSMYAWGVAVVLIAASLVMDFVPSIPAALRPRFGLRACWFQDDAAAVPYFYGLLSMIVGANVLLFIMTAIIVCRCCTKKKTSPEEENVILRKQDEGDYHAFRTSMLLFCAMGVPWIMDFILWFGGGPRVLWYLTDMLNTLQGVVIFCVFVLSKRVRRLVAERSDPYEPYDAESI